MAPIGNVPRSCDHDRVVNVNPAFQASPPRPARLTRGSSRVIAGVCSGIADYLAIDPVIVRVAFVVLTFATGLGLPIYALAWIMMPEPDVAAAPGVAPLAKKTTPATAEAVQPSNRGLYHGLAVGMIFFGGLLLLRNVGLAIPDSLLIPVALAGLGAAVVWARSGDGERTSILRWASRFTGRPVEGRRPTIIPVTRLCLGGLLVLCGFAVFIGTQSSGQVGPFEIAVAMGVTVVGLALLLGPWIWRLGNELGEERRERIRQEERADIAAHLHDSVLQTLALIQRSADSPKEVTALARRQERELRTWLYGDPGRRQNPSTLAGAMEAMVEEVERMHDVEVELITVGEDCPLDNRLAALVRAAREAAVNAAKHSGADEVSVYVEVEPDRASVFIRDRGKGFDPDDIPEDRRGIAESIRQRIERRGGRASIWSAIGEGTEVHLEVPRS
jgi:phage shock protein PspC (stress-responsive transcriptional regulator)/two-component sensor histidine kinase